VAIASTPATVEPAPPAAVDSTKAAPAAAQPAPQVTASAPALDDTGGEAASRLVAEGRALFTEGRVLEARRKFMAAIPDRDAMLALARSYDANYLSDLQKADGSADPQRALTFYNRAASLGSEGASADLERITGKVQSK
jgi:hypothetical protein